MSDTPRYRAFLSYSHRDAAVAQRLHRRLETYRVPSGLRARAALPPRLSPIFRDREELASATRLSDSIEAALDDSAALIVVCSPAAVASQWVRQEILRFRTRHPARPVFAFVVAGDPGADPRLAPDAALPLALLLDDAAKPDGALGEPLAADARSEGDGFASAALKLIAGLLGVRYDDLRQREARRRQQRWTLAVAASLALAATMAWLAWDATRARDVARSAQAQAELELQSERQTRNFLLSVFRLADAERSRGGEVTVREVLDRAVNRIDSTRFSRPAIRSRFLATMGQAYSSLGLHKRSVALLQQSIDSLPADATEADARAQRIDSRIELADVAYAMGDYDAADPLLAAVDAATDASAAQRARAENVRGDVLTYRERDADAVLAYRAALALADTARLGAEDDALLRSRSLTGLALLQQYAGDHAASDQGYAAAIALLEPAVGELHPATIAAIVSRGSNAYASGDTDTARTAWTRGLALAQSVYDVDGPEIGTIKNNLGRLQLETGDLMAAETLLRDALRSDRLHRSDTFDDLVYPLANLASVRLFRGDAVEARTLLDEALPIAEASDREVLRSILATLAEIDCAAGRPDSGLALAQRAVVADTAGDPAPDWRAASGVLALNLCRVAARQPALRADIDAALATVRARWPAPSPFRRHAELQHAAIVGGTTRVPPLR